MSRRGMIKKRCSACGRRVPEKRCPACKSDRFSWEFVVDIGVLGGKRRQVRRSGFATKAEAQAALVEIQSAVDTGSFVQPSKETTDAYLKSWLGIKASQLRPSTLASYKAAVEHHITPHIGDVPLQSLTPVMIDSLYAKLLIHGRRDGRGGLSPKTVRNVHVVLRKALGDAERKGLLSRNPAAVADAPHVMSAETNNLRTWNPDELRSFLNAIRTDRLYPAIHLAATTGLRRGEILGLRWNDVDLERARVSIRQTLVNIGYEMQFSTPKTKRGRRSVSLDESTLSVLREWRGTQLRDRMALGSGWEDSGLVFTTESGQAVHPDLFTKHFDVLVRRTKTPRIRLHDLRHTHATMALQAGVHPKTVSERLGHATVAFTLDRYSHAVPGLQEEAAEQIAKVVFGDTSRSPGA